MSIDIRHEPWIQNLLDENKCADVNNLSLDVIKEEIDNTKADIDNQKIWEMGSSTIDEAFAHGENIASLQDYLSFLHELKNTKEIQTININKNNPENKDIRFINSNYDELFKIPDGDYIKITFGFLSRGT
jgi:hypothetical protein